MSRELNEALVRVLNETGSDDDRIMLKKAFTTGDIIIASGDRAVSIKSNINSPIITGDNNHITLSIDGWGEQQELIDKVTQLLNLINLSPNLISPVNNNLQYSHYILAHFLDHYVQEINGCKDNIKKKKDLIKKARQALSISLICSDKVLLPAVSYIQSQITRSILKEYDFAFQSGLIELIGDGITWDDFCEMRLREYSNDNPEYKIYQNSSKSLILSSAFSSIEGSNTQFIKSSWSKRWNENQDEFKIFHHRDRLNLKKGFEDKVFQAAYEYDEKAFISRNIESQIFSEIRSLERSLLTDDICAIFFDYFLQNPKTIFLSQIPGFKCGQPRNNFRKIDFSELIRLLSARCNVQIPELLNTSCEEEILKFGAYGKLCIKDILQDNRGYNEIASIGKQNR